MFFLISNISFGLSGKFFEVSGNAFSNKLEKCSCFVWRIYSRGIVE